jgi:hypothetical protein
VKFHPLWQATQFALVLKSTNPRLASAEMALSSLSIQASNGARPDTTVRSYVAMDLATFSSDISWPGNAAWNKGGYSAMLLSLSIVSAGAALPGVLPASMITETAATEAVNQIVRLARDCMGMSETLNTSAK